jgi:hypothetical protein
MYKMLHKLQQNVYIHNNYKKNHSIFLELCVYLYSFKMLRGTVSKIKIFGSNFQFFFFNTNQVSQPHNYNKG